MTIVAIFTIGRRSKNFGVNAISPYLKHDSHFVQARCYMNKHDNPMSKKSSKSIRAKNIPHICIYCLLPPQKRVPFHKPLEVCHSHFRQFQFKVLKKHQGLIALRSFLTSSDASIAGLDVQAIPEQKSPVFFLEQGPKTQRNPR